MKRFCSRLFPQSLTFNKLYVGARAGQEPPQSWQGYWQRQEAGQRAPPHQQSPPGPPSPPSRPPPEPPSHPSRLTSAHSLATPPRVLLPHQCFEALLGFSAMLRPTGLQLLWDTCKIEIRQDLKSSRHNLCLLDRVAPIASYSLSRSSAVTCGHPRLISIIFQCQCFTSPGTSSALSRMSFPGKKYYLVVGLKQFLTARTT